MNEYLRKLQQDEMKIYNDHQRELKLGELYSQYHGNIEQIEKDYSLQKDDLDTLQEIKAADDLQKLHDQAFLDGFLNGGKH